ASLQTLVALLLKLKKWFKLNCHIHIIKGGKNMLTKRENLMEVIKGGNPDRFVKQYEAFEIMLNLPITRKKPPIGGEIVNEWGVTTRWPEGQLGAFPVHGPGYT